MRTPSRTTAELVEARMKGQLVLQFPFEDDDLGMFDHLVELESALMGRGHDVDRHDAGSGQFNIFVNTEDAETTFATIMPALQIIDGLKVAYRKMDSDAFTILWPPGCKRFDVV